MSHNTHSPSPQLASPTHTPPLRPARPRLSRGISSRKPAPPPVPPSLRDHPLLDAVAHGSSSAGTPSSITSPGSVASSRRSSISASSPRPLDKLPLPSPTNLWSLPPRPSPPISGPWSSPDQSEPVSDAMGLLDTVPAGSKVSVATPSGYPWHTAPGTVACTLGHGRAQGYEYMSMQLSLHPQSRRPVPPAHHPPGQSDGARVPASTSAQRHNVGALHTRSPQPSPPVTPAAA